VTEQLPPLEPMGDYLLGEDRGNDNSPTSLVLPDEFKHPYLARVLATGPKVQSEKLVKDVTVVFKEKAAVEVYVEAKHYLLIREGDVIACLTR
jgi:co-chaperonin GroES (HSP10)